MASDCPGASAYLKGTRGRFSGAASGPGCRSDVNCSRFGVLPRSEPRKGSNLRATRGVGLDNTTRSLTSRPWGLPARTHPNSGRPPPATRAPGTPGRFRTYRKAYRKGFTPDAVEMVLFTMNNRILASSRVAPPLGGGAAPEMTARSRALGAHRASSHPPNAQPDNIPQTRHRPLSVRLHPARSSAKKTPREPESGPPSGAVRPAHVRPTSGPRPARVRPTSGPRPAHVRPASGPRPARVRPASGKVYPSGPNESTNRVLCQPPAHPNSIARPDRTYPRGL